MQVCIDVAEVADNAACSRIDTPMDVVDGSTASFLTCCQVSNHANTSQAHRTITISSFGVTVRLLIDGTNFTTTDS